MRFQTAIVRTPCLKMVDGLTSSNLGLPDHTIALNQHKGYIDALKSCGLTVYEMPADENFPDSCFIEDTAIVNEKFAVICNMSELSRSGKEIQVQKKLLEFYSSEQMFTINAPGTLDGGDIMRVENSYYIGLSKRTNLEGAQRLKEYLQQFGFNTEFVKFDHCLHLKSEVNYLGENFLLVGEGFLKNPLFQHYNRILVEQDEIYAANSLRINDNVLVPKGFPRTINNLLDNGFNVIELDMSEFQKLDGGLSCLSLRF